MDYLNPKELVTLFGKLQKRADEAGCELLINYHSDLFQVETSLLFDGLGERVVIAVADTADRRLNPGFKQPFRILNGYILAAPVAVMDQAAAMQGPPVVQSLLQRIKHEPRMRRAADTPADDPAGKGIDDEGDIDKASPGRDISKVRDPKPVRRRCLEFPIDVILWTGRPLVRKCRAQRLSANRPLNPIRTHQARNGTARDTETFGA